MTERRPELGTAEPLNDFYQDTVAEQLDAPARSIGSCVLDGLARNTVTFKIGLALAKAYDLLHDLTRVVEVDRSRSH